MSRGTRQQGRNWKKVSTRAAISAAIVGWSIAGEMNLPFGALGSRLVVARPAEVFQPYMGQIRRAIPPNSEMRLPSQILLGGPGGLDPNLLLVKVLPATSPPRLTVSLFTCESGPFPCLVGSFAAEPATSTNAQRELNRHQSLAAPITLADGVRGYLIDGLSQRPPADFSSLMWRQERMIYTVSFPATERQNILYMSRQMATTPPLQSLQGQAP